MTLLEQRVGPGRKGTSSSVGGGCSEGEQVLRRSDAAMRCNAPRIYCTQSPEFLWQEAGQLGQVARTGKQDEGVAIAFDIRRINSLLLCNQFPSHTVF